jgi:hypothetical protein
MSENQLEMPVRTAGTGPITAQIAAIGDMNTSFLEVLTHPATRGLPHLLGLDGAVLAALHQLHPEHLRKIAQSPLLLAEFSSVPGISPPVGVADTPPTLPTVGTVWQRQLESFADRLLTCLWQAARRDRMEVAFCVGFDMDKCHELACLSFTKISHCTEQAAGCLQARLGSHSRYWADLIRMARSGTSAQQTASLLAGIQLSVLKH